MKKIIATTVVGAALTACASSGAILNVGPDTYTTSSLRHILAGGPIAAQEAAMQSADAYCQSMRKQILVKDTQARVGEVTLFNVTFQCLARGDRDLIRPNLVQRPDIVIENRGR